MTAIAVGTLALVLVLGTVAPLFAIFGGTGHMRHEDVSEYV
jgi:hypothetical protein